MRFIYLLLLSLNAAGQNTFEGIYKFKPGQTTTSVINDVASELKTKVTEVITSSQFDKHTGYRIGLGSVKERIAVLKLEDLFQNPHSKEPSYERIIRACFDPNHITYYISAISVNKDLKLERIYLYFSSDTLIRLECEQSLALEDAMEAKYGEPLLDNKTDSIPCIYKLTGREYKEEVYKRVKTWGTNVKAISTFEKKMDDHCEAQFSTSFIVEDSSTAKKFDEEEDLARLNVIKEEEESRKVENKKTLDRL